MKIKVIISVTITVALLYCLNRSWGSIPPLGKFLDPFHGFWANAAPSGLPSQQLNMKGLKEKVSVIYDSIGVPHIYAKNDEDLYYAQGYITAKDRLFQMEFQTHSGAGRISEIIGNNALDYDRGQRRMGMLHDAQVCLKALESDPIGKRMNDAYTAGVNEFISSLDADRVPFEYKLLDYKPEAWTNLKTSLLLLSMAKTLNSGDKDLSMTNVLALFGKETVDLLFPDNEHVPDPIVDNHGKWNFRPITLDTVPLAVPAEYRLNDKRETKTGAMSIIDLPVGQFNNDIGSNNWAIGSSRTKSGSPMLSNDPHLQLSVPSIWYVVHLNAPGVNTIGASLPGAPSIVIGYNDSIAWGVTNAQRDLVDWYKITFKDKTKNEYLSDGKWRKAEKVIEKFVVKGSSPFYDTVVYTHHGPVRFDESYHAGDQLHHYAYHWITKEAGNEFLTTYKLNRAKNYDDYMDALNHWRAPAQNFIFASVSGDLVMRIQGSFPVRRKNEGKFVLDGSRTSQEWHAMIPNDQLVTYKNPMRDFVSSANQYPADSTYPYYINGDSYEAYRNRRINSTLAALHSAVPQDMMQLQNDTYNLKASEVLPLMLSQLDSTSLSATALEAYKILRSWDYYNSIEAQAPAYFQAWWNECYQMLWSRLIASGKELDLPTHYTTIKLMHDNPDLKFFDDPATAGIENANEIMRLSFVKGLEKIAGWRKEHPTAKNIRWGDYKDTFIGHLLLGIPALSFHVEHGGGSSIVDASTHTWGPSWRMVVSLEKTGVRGWGVYPGGQSGNPGSPFYSNLLDHWAKGKYFKLHFENSPSLIAPFSIATTTLNPSAK